MLRSMLILFPLLILSGLVLLVGCEKSEMDFERIRGPGGPIPMESKMVQEGKGALTWKTPESGVVYVYDLNIHRVLYSQRIEKGQTFAVDPARNQMTLDGRTVNGPKLNKEHNHRIYFDRDRVETDRPDK